MNTFPQSQRSTKSQSYVQLQLKGSNNTNLNIFALLDSGASVSIVINQALSHVHCTIEPCNFQLNGVSGSSLKVLGNLAYHDCWIM